MRTPPRSVRPAPSRQRGAVALVFGLALVLLLAAGGLVLDLGHLYVLKSELQNATDSAALAGAKEIDLTAAGITKALAKAKAFAAANNYNFNTSVALSDGDVLFGASPDGPWVGATEAQASPAFKTFIKVASGDKTVPTYLMKVAGIASMTANASAVAGRFVVDITPLGICAPSPTVASSALAVGATGESELVEWGFRRGVSYDLTKMGPIAGPADPMLLNPVDSPPTACNMSHSSANFTAPFLCQGNSAIISAVGAEVYANTGVSATPVERAINSRFDDFPSSSACSPVTAPPDTNIQSYNYNLPNGTGLWSYARAVRAIASGGDFTAGSAFLVSDWTDLYGPGVPAVRASAAAAYPAGAGATPYAQTVAPWYLNGGTVHAPGAKRRVLNLAIVDCAALTSNSMSCKKVPTVGIGRFFLQRPAVLNGPPAGINVTLEFAGLIEPVPNSEIKLYK